MIPLLRTAAATIAVLALLGGCAVVSGSTFDSVAGSVSAGSDSTASISAGSDAEASDGTREIDANAAPLRVVTDPDGAEVFIDGRRRGTTPLDLADIDPGRYLLVVEKDGYYSERRRIDVPESGSAVIEIDLERITGFLDVSVRPGDALVLVDGDRLRDGFAELPIGNYTVRAEAFGYRSHRVDVRVREREVTRVALTLEPAPFEIDELSAWRRTFGPANPGLVGTTQISYRVSAPGSGRITIFDPTGAVVKDVDQGPYTTWEQEYRWDGSDGAGSTVEDGTYRVTVSATGDDGRVETASTTVTVDSSPVVRYRSIWSASPGLLYAPTRNALPAGQIQLSAQVAGIIAPFESRLVGRFPGRVAARIGIGSGLEFLGYAGATLHSNPLDDRFSLGGSLAWDGPSTTGNPDVGAGVVLGGMHQSAGPAGRYASPDTQASYPGLFASLPVSLRIRRVSLVLAPEYRLTVAPVAYGDGPLPANEWGSIAYLRGGVVADLEQLTLGVSAALRSSRLRDRPAVDLPFQAGAELHWIVPGSAVAVSAFVASEIESARDFYLMSGLGVGVLF
ncbi:MAG: PEGA domain-containing protein [Spirochaetota bacterium]